MRITSVRHITGANVYNIFIEPDRDRLYPDLVNGVVIHVPFCVATNDEHVLYLSTREYESLRKAITDYEQQREESFKDDNEDDIDDMHIDDMCIDDRD